MLKRALTQRLINLFKQFPAIAILGPRQSGKTTIAKAAFPHLKYINLEDLSIREYAKNDPKGFLEAYPDGMILDEIQNVPELISYLQVYIDKKDQPGLYVITGSHQILLNAKISQSLAGRIAINNLLPLSYQELQQKQQCTDINEVIFRGAYPRLFRYDIDPQDFYPSYIQTYIEKDIRQLINISDIVLFQKFLKLCVGRIGQILNLSSLANDCGISHVTAKKWLSLLEMSFIVYILKPHHNNFNKRLVKSPKIYFYDTGIACSLLGIGNQHELELHFATGALFENFILTEYIKNQYNKGVNPNCYFWRDKLGHEIDLVIENDSKLNVIEIKSGKTINTDYFKNIKYFDMISNINNPSYLIYNGETEPRTGTKVFNWKNLESLWDDLA